ncbi:MAG: tyrosine--tRNA ligase [Candidatus Doudnabacteria bacterium]|nr:tyrosine--tRNA ligase [Candidatus Doudnabacteria bacterium]
MMTMTMTDNQKISELLTRGVAEVIDHKHLESQLRSGKKLRVKLGIDPTAKNLHLGHARALWKLRNLQDLGHKIIFIIGDFTGLVGDTSDKESGRPMLSEKEVKANMQTYLKQVGKILVLKKAEVHYNSKWLKKLSLLEVATLADQFSLHDFISRELIAKRLKAGKRVSFREAYYPIMQGYDSVAVRADVELGGTDQRFNLLAGRVLQKFYKQEQQDLLILPLIAGLDGQMMSKSRGNVINILDVPNDMFGKVMSLRDELIVDYFVLLTNLPLSEVAKAEQKLKKGISPRDVKIELAKEIVGMYHGKQAAVKAQKEWEKVFSNKEKPTSMPEMKVSTQNVIDLLVETKLAPSKTEARRLVQQKAVKYNDEVIDEWDTMIDIQSGAILQVGKRKFVRLRK